MISVDIFVLIQERDDRDIDVAMEESKVAEIIMSNRFIGSTLIVFSSKGNFVGIRVVGCFPDIEYLNKAFDGLNAVDDYELIG